MLAHPNHTVLFVLAAVATVLIGFVVTEFLIIKYNGRPVPVPDIPRQKQTIGTGPPLTYVILGDSTSVSQGGEYGRGFAVQSAMKLAEGRQLTYQNFGVSGARTHDVLTKQLPDALQLQPDVVLLAVGANDVTHLTRLVAIERDMNAIVDKLYAVNPNIKIVITGSPQMGAVPRFPQPARWLAKQRTTQVNKVMQRIADQRQLVFAPIAEKTGPVFEQNPQLFAADKFHPTTEGYELWATVINDVL